MPNQAIDYPTAIDTLFGTINTAWPNVATIVGYTPLIRWQGMEQPGKPPVDKIWARVSTQIVIDEQVSLADSLGNKLFHAKGLIYIQLFCPRTDGDLSIGRLAAKAIQSMFSSGASSDGNIWFTKPRVTELTPDAYYYYIMINANFEYDHF